MTRLELEPRQRVLWVPQSLLGARARPYPAEVADVRRRRVVVNLGRLRAQVPAGDLQEVQGP